MPFALLFLLFIFLEIAGFVAMANTIGLLGVFALVAAGIIVGGLIIRTIGFASVARMQERANEGAPVGQEIGGLVLGFLGGLLLIVPGFLTDFIGLALLIKPIQTLLWPRYGRQMASRMPNVGAEGAWRSPGNRGTQSSPRRSAVIVEGEVVEETRDQTTDGRPDGEPSDNPWAR